MGHIGDLVGVDRHQHPLAGDLPLEDDLPVGLQIIGRAFDEATVLRVGSYIEQTDPMQGRRASVGA